MKFQNPSMQGSKVMLCVKKRNARTYERTRSSMPLFEVGGITKNYITVSQSVM